MKVRAADAQLLPAAIAPVLHSNLADVFWFLGLELADVPEAEAQKKQLTLLIQDLLREGHRAAISAAGF